MATTPNYSWVMPDSTDLVKDLPADFATFGNAVDATVYSNASAAIAKTLIDAKGDLIVGSAADTAARLAVGTNGQYLKANSSATNGVEWGDVSSGGMTLISETTASGLSSLSLSSIPSTYKSLLLVWHGIYHSSNGNTFALRLNNDSGNSYYSGGAYTNDTSANTPAPGARNWLDLSTAATAFGTETNNSTTDFSLGSKGYLKIDNYASTTKYKAFNGFWHFYQNVAAVARSVNIFGTYASTSAISSIDIVRQGGTGTFSNMTNSSIRLYGLS